MWHRRYFVPSRYSAGCSKFTSSYTHVIDNLRAPRTPPVSHHVLPLFDDDDIAPVMDADTTKDASD
ncbi:hypothetical protein [Candidatus Magnetobacterium casense]|uniref:hypothetical protein n=1 Tax=Candidatus Magnetobacterium casense TaxID=1455061 RepID=UPI001C46995A|nr:hypothetical protein [Candidatus Magnetobacterium casensis]